MAEVAPRRILHVFTLQPHLPEPPLALFGVARFHELGKVDAATKVIAGATDDQHLDVVVDVRLVE